MGRYSGNILAAVLTLRTRCSSTCLLVVTGQKQESNRHTHRQYDQRKVKYQNAHSCSGLSGQHQPHHFGSAPERRSQVAVALALRRCVHRTQVDEKFFVSSIASPSPDFVPRVGLQKDARRDFPRITRRVNMSRVVFKMALNYECVRNILADFRDCEALCVFWKRWHRRRVSWLGGSPAGQSKVLRSLSLVIKEDFENMTEEINRHLKLKVLCSRARVNVQIKTWIFNSWLDPQKSDSEGPQVLKCWIQHCVHACMHAYIHKLYFISNLRVALDKLCLRVSNDNRKNIKIPTK